MASSADVYQHEMPGGQYTNLRQQAQALGLGHRWPEICRTYAEVNRLFGDIVKVTPTSKVVGDMALFMVGNNLTAEDVLEGERELAFPESVVEFFEGRLGQPPGGFPQGAAKARAARPKTDARPARRQPARRPISPPPAGAGTQTGPPSRRPRGGHLLAVPERLHRFRGPPEQVLRHQRAADARCSSTA